MVRGSCFALVRVRMKSLFRLVQGLILGCLLGFGWSYADAAGDPFPAWDRAMDWCRDTAAANPGSTQCNNAHTSGDFLVWRDSTNFYCQWAAGSSTTNRCAHTAVASFGARWECPSGGSFASVSTCQCDGAEVPVLEGGVYACVEPPEASGVGTAVDGGALSFAGLSSIAVSLFCEPAPELSESVAPCVSRADVPYRPVMADATVFDADAAMVVEPLNSPFEMETAIAFFGKAFGGVWVLYMLGVAGGALLKVAKTAQRAM